MYQHAHETDRRRYQYQSGQTSNPVNLDEYSKYTDENRTEMQNKADPDSFLG